MKRRKHSRTVKAVTGAEDSPRRLRPPSGVSEVAAQALSYLRRADSLAHQGELAAATSLYQRAIALNPALTDAHHNLGAVLLLSGRTDDALPALRRATELLPHYARAHDTLGSALKAQGQLTEAAAAYRAALQCDPTFASAHSNLSLVLAEQGNYTAALRHAGQAVTHDPTFVPGHTNLAMLLQSVGRVREAIAHYREALHLQPHTPRTHSGLLFSLLHDDTCSPEEVFAEHVRYAHLHAASLAATITSPSNVPEPAARLRIGYVSWALCHSVIAFFFEPLLAAHDRSVVEVFCYSDTRVPDEVTRRLQSLSDTWRDTHGLTDEQMTDMIRQDRIDVLVDLDGHTGNGRLLVFARKPAPIQVTYLGYPATTGLRTIDYRITDAWADPIGVTDGLHTEELVRLPDGFLCYRPPVDAPCVSPLPAFATGVVTFGSLNKPSKITPRVAALWATILRQVANSRLVLKGRVPMDTDSREHLLRLFADHGIDGGRIELLDPVPSLQEQLALYARIDVALDPFPYNGTTTTCEALWMGVPVITLEGRAHVSRVGTSLLSQLDLPHLIARDAQDYVAIARRLASDLEALRALRASLRTRMARSPLTNEVRLARLLEQAYRAMWEHWCQSTVAAMAAE